MSTMPLAEQEIKDLNNKSSPLNADEVKQNLELLDSNWADIDDLKINRTFEFADFKTAIGFVNKIADLAEKTQHHPDLHIYYNQVVIELWTHSVNGLSQNDFFLAAKIDQLFSSMNP